MSKRLKNQRKRIFIACAVILLIAIIVLCVVRQNSKAARVAVSGQNSQNTVRGTPSTPTQHQSTTTNSNGQGGVIDNNGRTTGSLPPAASQWVSSSSGDITLQQPSASTSLSSGDTLSGLAKVSIVQFILTDDRVGQIAQGNLNVVNDKFSGTLQFTPHAKTGMLEVYYPNPSTGAEEDIISIHVNFN